MQGGVRGMCSKMVVNIHAHDYTNRKRIPNHYAKINLMSLWDVSQKGHETF